MINRYIDFLKNKTEREVVDYIKSISIKEDILSYSFGDIILLGKTYLLNNKNKSLIMFRLNNLETGLKIIAGHIDSPRIDIQQTQAEAKDDEKNKKKNLLYLSTHYYGGIKKYQWTTIPLAIHGVVINKSGEKINLSIGEDKDDPIFYISDLLPHLAEDQMKKDGSHIIEAGDLNLIIDLNDNENNVWKYIEEKYHFNLNDLEASELCAVPAYSPRYIGFTKNMLAAYGHDDKVCSFAAVEAFRKVKDETKENIMVVLTDKEEIGSDGVSGAKSRFILDLIEEIAKSMNRSSADLRANSSCLSSDVNSAYDPTFSSVFDSTTASYLGQGISINKFTGCGGKYSSSESSAEFVHYIKSLLVEENIPYKLSELGKVGQGGGGTIAKYFAELNIETLDVGVPVLSMHSPYEVISVDDLASLEKAYELYFTK